MTMVLEIMTALLAAFGLFCLGFLIYGRLVLPVGESGARVRATVTARGDGAGLEQAVSGLLWLRRSGLWRGSIRIEDAGLDSEGLALARKLAEHTDIELQIH